MAKCWIFLPKCLMKEFLQYWPLNQIYHPRKIWFDLSNSEWCYEDRDVIVAITSQKAENSRCILLCNGQILIWSAKMDQYFCPFLDIVTIWRKVSKHANATYELQLQVSIGNLNSNIKLNTKSTFMNNSNWSYHTNRGWDFIFKLEKYW